ncbi:MAG: DUF6941 family protein, partial [Actinomycetota bacterium]
MSIDPTEPTGLELTVLSLCDYANVREGLLNITSGGITRIAVHQGFPAEIEAHLAMSVYVQPHRVGEAHHGRVMLRYPDTAAEIARIDFEFNVDADRNPGEGLNIPFALPLRSAVFPHAGQVDVSVSLDGAPAGLLSFWLIDGTA